MLRKIGIPFLILAACFLGAFFWWHVSSGPRPHHPRLADIPALSHLSSAKLNEEEHAYLFVLRQVVFDGENHRIRDELSIDGNELVFHVAEHGWLSETPPVLLLQMSFSNASQRILTVFEPHITRLTVSRETRVMYGVSLFPGMKPSWFRRLHPGGVLFHPFSLDIPEGAVQLEFSLDTPQIQSLSPLKGKGVVTHTVELPVPE